MPCDFLAEEHLVTFAMLLKLIHCTTGCQINTSLPVSMLPMHLDMFFQFQSTHYLVGFASTKVLQNEKYVSAIFIPNAVWEPMPHLWKLVHSLRKQPTYSIVAITEHKQHQTRKTSRVFSVLPVDQHSVIISYISFVGRQVLSHNRCQHCLTNSTPLHLSNCPLQDT